MTQRNASQPVPQSIDDHQISLTFFENAQARKKSQVEWTLPTLADEILNEAAPKRDRLPWLKLAVFGENRSKGKSLRNNENVLAISGVEVDYDAGKLTFDEGLELVRAAGLRALLYTTPSYRKGVTEKWRVLCPTSVQLPPDARHGLVAALKGVIGGGIDDASFTLSQSFYFGAVDGNPDHRVELVDGDFIDLRDDLAAGAIGPDPKGKTDRTIKSTELNVPSESPSYSDAELDALLDRSQYRNSDGSGNWHPNMLAVTGSLVSRGWGDDAIHAKTAPFADGGVGDDDVQKLIDGARAKWGVLNPDVPAGARLGPEVAAAIGADVPGIIIPNWRERYVETGYPKASLHNARLAIEAIGVVCSEDVFHNELYIGRNSAVSPNAPNVPFAGLVTDAAIGALRVYLSNTFGLDFTEKHVRDAVNTMCHEHQFNPVVDMLAEAEASWDGKPRLDRMAVDHFNADDTPLNRACIRKTMIAAVARARQPGCKFDTITVLEAPEGWNKSSAWAVLAGEGNFSDESILGKASREVQEQLAGVWFHENAELAGITKSEVEVIKAFASRQVDRARPAYGHFLVKQDRHSIEVGTTNDDRYLLSMTGNRRFWPVAVRRPIDLKRLRAERLQLWGEAAHYQAQGEGLTLPEALWGDAGAAQEERRVQHPWESKLAGMVPVPENDPTGGWGHRGADVIQVVDGEQRVATADIFDRVLGIAAGQLNNGHAKTVASIMRSLGWEHCVFKRDEKTVKGYRRT